MITRNELFVVLIIVLAIVILTGCGMSPEEKDKANNNQFIRICLSKHGSPRIDDRGKFIGCDYGFHLKK